MQKDEREVVAVVAAEVRRGRKALGWSQLQLAERAELSLNYVSLIEREEQLPTVRVLLQIARALDVTLGDLVVGRGTPAQREPDAFVVEAMGILRGLPVEARPVALGVLRGVAEATAPRRAEPAGSGVRAKRKRRG